jgi:hypothetical protein
MVIVLLLHGAAEPLTLGSGYSVPPVAAGCGWRGSGFDMQHFLYFFPELQGQGKFRWILFDIDCAIGSVVLQDRGLEGRMQILLYNIA